MPEDANEVETNNEKTLEDFKSEENNEGQLLRAFLKREGGNCKLYVQVSEEIEEFFSCDDIDQSSQWHGQDDYHEFYYKDYSDEFRKHVDMKNDKFGGSYIDNGHVNIALLRTVDLSEGVEFEVPGKYSEDSLLDSMKELKEEVEIIYKQFIRPVRIEGSLSLTQL